MLRRQVARQVSRPRRRRVGFGEPSETDSHGSHCAAVGSQKVRAEFSLAQSVRAKKEAAMEVFVGEGGVKLGDVVRDRISGFAGVATSRTEYLNGCVRWQVSPQHLHDGKPI